MTTRRRSDPVAVTPPLRPSLSVEDLPTPHADSPTLLESEPPPIVPADHAKEDALNTAAPWREPYPAVGPVLAVTTADVTINGRSVKAGTAVLIDAAAAHGIARALKSPE